MNFRHFRFKTLIIVFVGLFAVSSAAHADYTSRLSLGAGIASFQNPSATEFELGAEFEYRLDPMWGLGIFANVIFTNPVLVDIGVPAVYWHPFSSEFLISGAPLIELGDSDGTHVGVHFGTRIPLHLGSLTLIPMVGVAFIDSMTRFDYGLGLEF